MKTSGKILIWFAAASVLIIAVLTAVAALM
jgi:hypothetical protein